MNMYLQTGLLIIILSIIPGCSWFSSSQKNAGCGCSHGVCRVGASAKEQKVSLRLVNVLDKELFDDAHIAGGEKVESICVSVDDLARIAKSWDLKVPVVTYCSNYFCSASGEAASLLKSMGFESVYAYEGGIAEWYQLHHDSAPALLEGPMLEEYLQMVIPMPEDLEEKDGIITAAELQNMIKKATL